MTDTNDDERAVPDFEEWDYRLTADAPPPDRLFGALADSTRRRTMWLLLEDGRTTVDELADTLLGWRTGERAVVGPEERRRIVLLLYHAHLPMLEDCGLIAYDTDDGEVRLASLPEPVRDLIRFAYWYEQSKEAGVSR